jgi:integrase
MAHKPRRPPVVCEFFTWRLFTRDGVYYADGRTGKYNLGKHSLGTRDAEEAVTNLRRLDRKMAIERGLAPSQIQSVADDLSVRDGWELFLADCRRPGILGGVAQATGKRYRSVKDKHVKFCDERGLRTWSAVTTDTATSYGAWLERKKYADRSIYLEVTLLKSVVLWLIAKGHLPASARLTAEVEKPKGSDTYCYTSEEVATMVTHCRSRPDLDWLAGVLIGLSCTGLRIGELASLRWSDLDLTHKVLRLTDERSSRRRKAMGTARRTKGKRSRILPVHDDMLDVLSSMKRQDHLVFHGPRGGRLKPDTVRSIFVREVIEPLQDRFPTLEGEIGFEHGRIHSFRHYFCSQAFLGDADEAVIKDWLGHQDSKMVALYRHLRDDESRRKMQRINFLGTGDRMDRSPVRAVPGGVRDSGQQDGPVKEAKDEVEKQGQHS